MTRVNAVVVHRESDGRIVPTVQQVDVGEPSPGWLRIRPSFVGICGSDLEQLDGHTDPSFRIEYPHTLGHEWSGVVETVGSDASRFAAGDLVIGHGHLGGNRWFGVSCDGAMAELFLVPEEMCFAVPAGIGPLQAALIEPAACCLQGLRTLGGVDAAHRVVVFGCGAIGLATLALVARVGAEVVAVDRSEFRLQIARGLGAAATVRSDPGVDLAGEIIRHFKGRGADVVIEGSGAPAAQAAAIDVAAQNARILFMGITHRRADGVALNQIQNRALTLMSSTGAPPSIWEPAIRLLERTKLDLTPMASDIFAFAAFDDAVAAARDSDRHAKVVMTPV